MESKKRIGPPTELTTLTSKTLGVGRNHPTGTMLAKVTHDFMLPQILCIYFSPYLSEPTAEL